MTRITAATALCNIEANPEVIEDQVSEVMQEMEKKLWPPPSGEEEEEDEEEGNGGEKSAISAWKISR